MEIYNEGQGPLQGHCGSYGMTMVKVKQPRPLSENDSDGGSCRPNYEVKRKKKLRMIIRLREEAGALITGGLFAGEQRRRRRKEAQR